MNVTRSERGPQGRLHPPLGNLLHGWVWHPGFPKRRWWVEILIEELTLAVVEARLYHPGLAEAGIGDGSHAFCFALPEALFNDPAPIRARLANTHQYLPGVYRLGTVARIQSDRLADRVPLDGELVIGDGGLHLRGWVSDPSRTNEAVELICYRNGHELCRATTDDRNQFAIALPLALADGQEHRIQILANGRPLPGSPVRILTHRRGPQHLLHDLLDRLDADTPRRLLNDRIVLLDRLLHDAQVRLPQGANMADYPTWFAAFEANDYPPDPNSAPVQVLIRHGAGLERTLASLRAQTHIDWRAIILGLPDGELSSDDPRIQGRPETSVALTADWLSAETLLTFIEAGDHLPPQALAWVAWTFDATSADALYTDCDQDSALGGRGNPWFKPAWDFELFQGIDYLHHLFVVRAGLVTGYELTRINDLPYLAIAALLAQSPPDRPWHLPRVLYHRRHRAPLGSRIGERRRRLMQELLNRQAPESPPEVTAHPSDLPALRQVRWPLPRFPNITLLIPTRDRLDLIKPCVETVLAHTDYPNFEILILDNGSVEPDTLDWLDGLAAHPVCRILKCPGPFNYSRINNAGARHGDSEFICLLNNDILLPETSGHWLREMAGRLLQPDVGAVGAKLLWPNRMVQHAGVTLGVGGVAGHIGNLWLDTDPGYQSLNQLARSCSAVTAACLLTKRALYLDLGGLDGDLYPVAFNDVDYCLRIRERGLRVVWTPFASLIHLESQSRGLDHKLPEKQARARREIAGLQQRWASQLTMDPYYHPALSLYPRQAPFEGLAVPPRPRNPR